jgi:hypothetical protein
MSGHRDNGTRAEHKEHDTRRRPPQLMSMPWGDDVRMANIPNSMWDKYDSNPYNDDEVLNLSYQGVDPADIITNRND